MLRYIISCLLILICSFSVSSQGLNDVSFGTDSTFEVVTWNIETFPKNGTASLDSVAKLIEALDVDVLGIQEISDSALCRQLIGGIPGYEIFMDHGWFGGLAYVYKTSSISVQSIYKIYDTSPYWNTFPRSPLVMELTYMGKEIVVINNHFKCCGDGILDVGNTNDEEARRHQAGTLLKQHIDVNFSGSRVIVIGDLNDVITDGAANNVFQMFLNDTSNYRFADEAIATGSSANWSFPGWPSHLDHILVTNELFDAISNPSSLVETIKIDDFLGGGFSAYDATISDHRPVGLKLHDIPTTVHLNEVSYSSVKVAPNPTNGFFTVDFGELELPSVVIFDVTGRIVFEEPHITSAKLQINIAEPRGMYFVQVHTTEEAEIFKVIKL